MKWDCHAHVFGPLERYPYAQDAPYEPPEALPEQAAALMRALGTERIVLVQPRPYGGDHRCLLGALQALGRRAFGVAALTNGVGEGTLRALERHPEVRGLRVNAYPSRDTLGIGERIAAGAHIAAAHGWHLELHVGEDVLAQLGHVLESLEASLVLDHMARLSSPDGEAARVVRRLLATGRCWVKLSGADRLQAATRGAAPIAEIAAMLAETRADRLVWGSDWPHTPINEGGDAARHSPFRGVDTVGLLELLAAWVPQRETRDRILTANPAALYAIRGNSPSPH